MRTLASRVHTFVNALPCPAPIHLAINTDTKIDSAVRPAATVSNERQRLAGLHPLSGLFEKALVVTIECHIATAMIHNHQQPESPQPVGKGHPSPVYRPDLCPLCCAYQYPVPFDIASLQLSERSRQLPFGRPAQTAFQGLECLLLSFVQGLEYQRLLQFIDQTL